MAVEIPLNRGAFAIIDDDDAVELLRWRWHVSTHPNMPLGYAARGNYPSTSRVMMHREIAGAASGEVVDHINRNTLDNRKSNLRICTKQQNVWNRLCKRNDSGFTGVSFHRNTWYAHIQTDHIGVFSTALDAAHAYDREAASRYGEFAVLNFPENHPFTPTSVASLRARNEGKAA